MVDLFSIEPPVLREKLFLLKRELSLRGKKREGSDRLLALRLAEAARVLFALSGEGDELLSPELREGYEAFCGTLPPELAEGGCRILCRELAGHLYAAGKGRLPDAAGAPGEKVCYVRNRFSDEAYDLLRPLLGEPVALYADSFDAGAEQLAGEECAALLLPCETGEGAELRGVRALVTAYDFKKSAVCTLHSESGDSTLYALYRRELTASLRPPADRLEATLPEGGAAALTDLLAYAALCGAETLRATLQTTDDGSNCRFLFRGEGETLTALRVYFALQYPHASCDGIYFAADDGAAADFDNDYDSERNEL